jgi:hypothetical protein
MALSTRPFDKSQHCSQCPTRGVRNLVLRGWDLQRLEVKSFSPVDPWETYVALPSGNLHSIDSCLCSGLWKKRHLVRGLSVYSVYQLNCLLVPL